jgi:hypothetical protein
MGFVQTGSRVKAARLAQMDDRMHWHWLKTDPLYTEAFGRAEQMAGDRVEDRLYTLALEGTRKGVYHHGVRIGEEDVVYPTLILAALNGIKPERYKYRVDTSHSVSPAMQALMQQWQSLRESMQAPPALPEAPSDDAEAELELPPPARNGPARGYDPGEFSAWIEAQRQTDLSETEQRDPPLEGDDWHP